ncbi:hypothetical protein BDR06DRAFT_1007111 [Suillus hirtellus]|nr:hypothetical protein BDR06DRAFT_1007111 [Suillus hirtellus]
MTIVSNDPTWWPVINSYRLSSYLVVGAFVALMYDWALTFGQEVELIWGQRWSLMTVMYLSTRYLGILYAALFILGTVPTIWLTDTDVSLDTQIISGFEQILQVVKMFVLGPRLILGVREYHAKLVAHADAATGMTSIAFQEHVHISTGSGV